MSVTSSESNGSVQYLNDFNYGEEDIIVTSSFKQKNCLGRGGFGFVFKDTSNLECQRHLPSELKNAPALLILIVVLVLRPQGILGRKQRVG
jgi:hypothetical protein